MMILGIGSTITSGDMTGVVKGFTNVRGMGPRVVIQWSNVTYLQEYTLQEIEEGMGA